MAGSNHRLCTRSTAVTLARVLLACLLFCCCQGAAAAVPQPWSAARRGPLDPGLHWQLHSLDDMDEWAAMIFIKESEYIKIDAFFSEQAVCREQLR